jgi:predicted nucleic acid-binding protein
MSLSSVCIDASLALAWLLHDEYREQADELLKAWARDAIDMVAPPLIHAEVSSAVRRNVHFKRILPAEGESLFGVYSQIPIRIVDDWDVYRTGWRLAAEYDLPVCYDMQYLAVAELQDCEFWTLDRRLINAVARRNRRLKWVGGYEPSKANSKNR